MIDAAVNGNEARFINHSCDPNCDAVIDDGRIWIETIRDIEPGEELAYDYAYVLEERHTPAAKRRYPVSLRRGELPRDDPGEEAVTAVGKRDPSVDADARRSGASSPVAGQGYSSCPMSIELA